MSVKKIIVFSSHTTLESGGVGTHLKHLISELKNSKYDSKVVLGARKKDLMLIKAVDKIISIFSTKDISEVIYLNLYILALRKKLVSVLNTMKDLNNDSEVVIHCHDKQTAIATYMIKDKYPYKIKVIQTLHAPFADQFKLTLPRCTELFNYSKILDSGSTLNLDYIIGVDLLQCQIAKENTWFDNSKMNNISNAVDTSELDKVKKQSKLVDEDYFVVARHLGEKHGVIFAVKGFEKFLISNPNCKLYIIGSGIERSNISDYINKNNLSKNVILLGRKSHSETLNLICNAKASIIPSIPIGRYIEATSLTMLESMYFEVPVVASNIGGLAEVIKHEFNGFLFEPKDVQKLSVILGKILQDKDLINNIKTNSKQTILDDFTSKIWFNKISLHYDSLK